MFVLTKVAIDNNCNWITNWLLPITDNWLVSSKKSLHLSVYLRFWEFWFNSTSNKIKSRYSWAQGIVNNFVNKYILYVNFRVQISVAYMFCFGGIFQLQMWVFVWWAYLTCHWAGCVELRVENLKMCYTLSHPSQPGLNMMIEWCIYTNILSWACDFPTMHFFVCIFWNSQSG